MLKISSQQMAELNRRYNAYYEAQTAGHLCTKYTGWSEQLGYEGVQAFVNDGVKRAERHRITEPENVTAFLEYCVLLGVGFEQNEEHEWALDILQTRNLSGGEKVRRMMELQPL